MQCNRLDEFCSYELDYLAKLGIMPQDMLEFLDLYSSSIKAKYCTEVCPDYVTCSCLSDLDLINDNGLIIQLQRRAADYGK